MGGGGGTVGIRHVVCLWGHVSSAGGPWCILGVCSPAVGLVGSWRSATAIATAAGGVQLARTLPCLLLVLLPNSFAFHLPTHA